MNTRNGFVSNSSSSSFVVAIKPGMSKIKIALEIDLDKFAQRAIGTFSELDEYWKECGYGDYAKDTYQACKKAIDAGKVILFGEFNDSGSEAEAFLCDRGLKPDDLPDGEIIVSSGGY